MKLHGDVIIKLVPVNGTGKKVNKTEYGYVLAEGEHTGHKHTVQEDIEMYERDGKYYIRSSTDWTVTHQEHNPITLPATPAGMEYEIDIKREFDPFEMEVRRVQD